MCLNNPNASFRLACRLPLCCYGAWSSLAVSELQLSAALPLRLNHQVASLLSWTEFNCLWWVKRRSYWFIGKTLLTAWSCLCGKWRLHSCAKITIKAAMWRAASYSESSIRFYQCCLQLDYHTTHIQGRSYTSYTAPCNGAISHGGLCRPHTQRKCAQVLLSAVWHFTRVYLQAKIAVDAGDIRTWRTMEKTPNLNPMLG